MHATILKAHVSYAEYLEFERTAKEKHEYYAGMIYAMAGGTPEHSLLAANVIRMLGNLVIDRPCTVYTSDLRIRITTTGLSTYPDVSVVCGPVERAADDPHAIANPTLLVEVLSDTTEAYDRGEKFAHYRRLPTLREYMLVSQRQPRLEVFQRTKDGGWLLHEAVSDERVVLISLGSDLAVAVNEVYRNVNLAS